MGQAGSSEISIFGEGEMEAEFEKHGGNGNISVKDLISDGYDLVIDSIIRPTRAKYTLDALGPPSFELEDPLTQAPIYVSRTDRVVLNERQLGLACTHWNLLEDDRVTVKPAPCLIYLHSNVGSRKDALRVRDIGLRLGFSVFAFDFSGSGRSDGIYVTMGWLESSDLKYILDDLDTCDSVTSIAFFAHSMGCYPAMLNVASRFQQTAELAIKGSPIDAIPHTFRKWNVEPYAKRITGLVFDGAYSTMDQCIDGLVLNVKNEGFGAPKLVLKAAAHFIQKSVENRTGVRLEFLRPVDVAAAIPSIPALFVCGSVDKYVGPAHTHELTAAYGGPCAKLVVDGADHYSPRPAQVYQLSMLFLHHHLTSSSSSSSTNEAAASMSPLYQTQLHTILTHTSRPSQHYSGVITTRIHVR
ncbi:hypothetical protein DYB28_000978 [Aphanomyces astaci]|uniref:AB hydrolase-1 domain-containing protein n=1 Tax=Aphanomyces astaci TaxID=112090 RepID=A0A9X8DZ06_APHAT|nr:hypothetical protein DYB28_000978 [Aphanomyces astaci]